MLKVIVCSFVQLTVLTQIKAAEFLSSLVILFLFLKKRNGFYSVLSSFTSARFVGVFRIPFQWWKLFLAALLVQFQLAAFERARAVKFLVELMDPVARMVGKADAVFIKSHNHSRGKSNNLLGKMMISNAFREFTIYCSFQVRLANSFTKCSSPLRFTVSC